jgi:hypothetical protein
MKIFQVTLWMYATALNQAWDSVRKNWVVSFAPVVYGILLTVIGSLVAPFGIVGGILYSLASSACISSALYLIQNLVEVGKASVNDFLNGFTAYIWEVITISFILWIPMRIAATGLATVPNGALLFFLLKLGLYILLNAVPELIYQSRSSGLELIGASYNFIVENWIEWLIPNLIFAAAGLYLLDVLESVIFTLPAFLHLFIYAFVLGLGLSYFMTFRGFLFAQLYGTTRRARIYRYNAR